MKLSRKLVIDKLEIRIKELDAEAEEEAKAATSKKTRALKAFSRIKIDEESTYDQLKRAEDLIREARYGTEESRRLRGRGKRSYYQKQIEREIALLQLSEDDYVSVRVNSSLADFLSK